MSKIVVYGFDTSNNIKVRVGLGYKGLDYEFRRIEPGDREEIVRVSGQHLTPVLTHGDTVLFDSAAILRYLDANFPDTRKLFGESRSDQWAIEDKELFARTELAGPMMRIVHRRVSGQAIDEALQLECAEAFETAAMTIAKQRGDREWWHGERMTVADITATAVLYRVAAAEMFDLGPAATSLAPWVERVVAHDAHLPK